MQIDNIVNILKLDEADLNIKLDRYNPKIILLFYTLFILSLTKLRKANI